MRQVLRQTIHLVTAALRSGVWPVRRRPRPLPCAAARARNADGRGPLREAAAACAKPSRPCKPARLGQPSAGAPAEDPAARAVTTGDLAPAAEAAGRVRGKGRAPRAADAATRQDGVEGAGVPAWPLALGRPAGTPAKGAGLGNCSSGPAASEWGVGADAAAGEPMRRFDRALVASGGPHRGADATPAGSPVGRVRARSGQQRTGSASGAAKKRARVGADCAAAAPDADAGTGAAQPAAVRAGWGTVHVYDKPQSEQNVDSAPGAAQQGTSAAKRRLPSGEVSVEAEEEAGIGAAQSQEAASTGPSSNAAAALEREPSSGSRGHEPCDGRNGGAAPLSSLQPDPESATDPTSRARGGTDEGSSGSSSGESDASDDDQGEGVRAVNAVHGAAPAPAQLKEQQLPSTCRATESPSSGGGAESESGSDDLEDDGDAEEGDADARQGLAPVPEARKEQPLAAASVVAEVPRSGGGAESEAGSGGSDVEEEEEEEEGADIRQEVGPAPAAHREQLPPAVSQAAEFPNSNGDAEPAPGAESSEEEGDEEEEEEGDASAEGDAAGAVLVNSNLDPRPSPSPTPSWLAATGPVPAFGSAAASTSASDSQETGSSSSGEVDDIEPGEDQGGGGPAGKPAKQPAASSTGAGGAGGGPPAQAAAGAAEPRTGQLPAPSAPNRAATALPSSSGSGSEEGSEGSKEGGAPGSSRADYREAEQAQGAPTIQPPCLSAPHDAFDDPTSACRSGLQEGSDEASDGESGLGSDGGPQNMDRSGPQDKGQPDSQGGSGLRSLGGGFPGLHTLAGAAAGRVRTIEGAGAEGAGRDAQRGAADGKLASASPAGQRPAGGAGEEDRGEGEGGGAGRSLAHGGQACAGDAGGQEGEAGEGGGLLAAEAVRRKRVRALAMQPDAVARILELKARLSQVRSGLYL